MEQIGTKTQADGTMLFAGTARFDPIEAGVRGRLRGFVEPRGSPDVQELLKQELATASGEAAEGGGT